MRDWHAAGVWDRLHELLLAKLRAADQLDWSRAAVDSFHVRAPKGELTGPSPVDRGRPGSKHHVLMDGNRIPLAVAVARPTATTWPCYCPYLKYISR